MNGCQRTICGAQPGELQCVPGSSSPNTYDSSTKPASVSSEFPFYVIAIPIVLITVTCTLHSALSSSHFTPHVSRCLGSNIDYVYTLSDQHCLRPIMDLIPCLLLSLMEHSSALLASACAWHKVSETRSHTQRPCSRIRNR